MICPYGGEAELLPDMRFPGIMGPGVNSFAETFFAGFFIYLYLIEYTIRNYREREIFR
jgi:hypothetical protein